MWCIARCCSPRVEGSSSSCQCHAGPYRATQGHEGIVPRRSIRASTGNVVTNIFAVVNGSMPNLARWLRRFPRWHVALLYQCDHLDQTRQMCPRHRAGRKGHADKRMPSRFIRGRQTYHCGPEKGTIAKACEHLHSEYHLRPEISGLSKRVQLT